MDQNEEPESQEQVVAEDAPWVLSRWIVRLSTVVAVALMVISGASVARSTIRSEAFDLSNGWEAFGEGDLRFAWYSFARAESDGRTTPGILRGLTCSSWVTGYQDVGLTNYQLFLNVSPELLVAENPCIGPLSDWGLAIVDIEGTQSVFPKPRNEDERELEADVLDEELAASHRVAAMACLTYGRQLPLLTATHLLLADLMFSADAQKEEATPVTNQRVIACWEDLSSEFVVGDDGAVYPKNLRDLVAGALSPIPSSAERPLQRASRIGPDGEEIPSDAQAGSDG